LQLPTVGARLSLLEVRMSELSFAEQLALAAHITGPAVERAIHSFGPGRGSRGLDAGCGGGHHTLRLARMVGEEGSVAGLDISPDNLSAARVLVGESPAGRRVRLVQGNLLGMPFDDSSFDWAWCGDTLWPSLFPEPGAAVKALARTVRPGGRVALLYWSGESLLPGYPELEARLRLLFARSAPYTANIEPAHQHLRAAGWLQQAGLEDVKGRSFLSEIAAPLAPDLRRSLAFCFRMLWGKMTPLLEPEDRALAESLTAPTSPEFIGDCDDYYGFVTYTMFSGRIPARGAPAGPGHDCTGVAP